MSKRVDLAGQKFGRLTALEFYDVKSKVTRWLCKCECGNNSITTVYNLRSGKAKSCGCLQKESAHEQGLANEKHGMCRRNGEKRLYVTWRNMIQRCANPNNHSFERYGGRGISVCEKWQDFETFMEWSMQNGYTDELTLDRIDNDGNYEPNNCKWATRKEQSNNRRTSHFVKIEGEEKTIAEWCDISGINRSTFCDRLRRGWKGTKLLSPIRKDVAE